MSSVRAILTTYIILAVFNFVDAPYIVWPFYSELAGLTLEPIDDVFPRDDKHAGSHKFALQWPIVGRVAATAAIVKRAHAAAAEGAVQLCIAWGKESVDSTEVVETKS